MRNFSKGAVVVKTNGGHLRLILDSPTGEKVYHDLSSAEAEAIRESLPASQPSKGRRSAKEN